MPFSRRRAIANSVKQADRNGQRIRNCVPLSNWPHADHIAWQAAIEVGGLAVNWLPNTRKGVVQTYSVWLAFLGPDRELDLGGQLIDRFNPVRLSAFIEELKHTMKPTTVRNKVTNLSEAIRVMVPGSRLECLVQARRQVMAWSKPARLALPREDPTRRCMPFVEWPEIDRLAWTAAIAKADTLLDEAGLASNWRPATLKWVRDGYGRWLTFLDRQGLLDHDCPPADRLTEDRLRALIVELKAAVSSNTLRNRIVGLKEAMRVMAPDREFRYLRRAQTRLKARALPLRNKREQMVPSHDIYRLGAQLLSNAERDDRMVKLKRACLYRDGLMIMMLACRPIRRRNFASLRLGHQLLKWDDLYLIVLDGMETKSHREYELAFPAAMTIFIERYMDHYRQQLLNGSQNDHFWISGKCHPLVDTGIYGIVTRRTREAFGFAIPPHRFRDIAVTSMGEIDPELVRTAPMLLHHSDLRVSEKYYNQARDAAATNVYQMYIKESRASATRNKLT